MQRKKNVLIKHSHAIVNQLTFIQQQATKAKCVKVLSFIYRKINFNFNYL